MNGDDPQSQLRSEISCPLTAAHTRLRQAHELWHRSAASYPHPEEFVLNLNQLILTLRQVTWMLQTQKDRIEDFDPWYGQWQERMKADPLMAWLKDARTTIEHVGDLDLESTALVTVVASWLDGPYSEFEVPPHLGPEEIAASFRTADLPDQVLREGLLRVERRWVSSDLPGQELTEVCAHGYGFVATILAEAHERLGIQMRTFGGETHAGRHDRIDHLGGRLPCMLMTREQRTAHLHLASGQLIELDAQSVDWDQNDAQRFERKSEEMLVDWETLSADVDRSDPFDIAAKLSTVARRMLAHDGWHDQIAFYFTADGEALGLSKFEFEGQAEKYLAFRNIADEAEQLGADTVVYIGEVWTAPLRSEDDPRTMKRASERTDRTEALVVMAMTADGRAQTFHSPFTRDRKNRPVLAETIEVGREFNASFFPLRSMWHRREEQRAARREEPEKAAADHRAGSS